MLTLLRFSSRRSATPPRPRADGRPSARGRGGVADRRLEKRSSVNNRHLSWFILQPASMPRRSRRRRVDGGRYTQSTGVHRDETVLGQGKLGVGGECRAIIFDRSCGLAERFGNLAHAVIGIFGVRIAAAHGLLIVRARVAQSP